MPPRRHVFNRSLGVILSGILLLPAASVAQPQPEQVVYGEVLMPAKWRNWDGCVHGGHEDIDGDAFKVDPETRGYPFILEATSGVAVDLDIFFSGNGGGNGYSARGPGEHGVVPPNVTSAAVCISDGLKAEYVYRAGPAVAPPTVAQESRAADHSANLRLAAHAVTPDSPRKLAFQEDLMIAGGSSGMNIFRLRDRAPYMKHVTFYECHGSRGDVSIWGDYAFQSVRSKYPYAPLTLGEINAHESETCNNTNDSKGKSGIRVVDISDPEHPTQAGFVETPCGSQTHTLVPRGDKLYIYVPIPCDDSIPDEAQVKPFTNQIHVLRFDPRHPDRPEHVGSPTLTGQVGCYDITVFAPRKLAACTQWFNPALSSALLDISDPANPRVLGKLPLPEGTQWAMYAAFTWDGRYLLVGDGNGAIDERYYATPICTGDASADPGRVWVFDVADRQRPQRVGSFYLPRPATSPDLQCAPHELNVIPMKNPDRYLAVAGWNAGGLTVIDFSEPSEPRELAHWQPAGASQVRGSYWYQGRIYSVEYWSGAGIRVFELAGATERDAYTYSDRLNPQTQLAEFRKARDLRR